MLTRFKNLNAEDRTKAFKKISEQYYSSKNYSKIENYLTRIDLNDSPNGEHYEIKSRLSWQGTLPANATISFVKTFEDLTKQFKTTNSVFTEKLDFEDSMLETYFKDERYAQPHLSFSKKDSGKEPELLKGTQTNPGTFTYTNTKCENANIQLSLRYPFPYGVRMFPLLLRQHRIVGPAKVQFAVNTTKATRPQVLSMLGDQNTWTSKYALGDEISVQIGTTNKTIEGTGLIFTWED